MFLNVDKFGIDVIVVVIIYNVKWVKLINVVVVFDD